jgi:hypothetical protein
MKTTILILFFVALAFLGLYGALSDHTPRGANTPNVVPGSRQTIQITSARRAAIIELHTIVLDGNEYYAVRPVHSAEWSLCPKLPPNQKAEKQ